MSQHLSGDLPSAESRRSKWGLGVVLTLVAALGVGAMVNAKVRRGLRHVGHVLATVIPHR
jgi:hypothetical protein